MLPEIDKDTVITILGLFRWPLMLALAVLGAIAILRKGLIGWIARWEGFEFKKWTGKVKVAPAPQPVSPEQPLEAAGVQNVEGMQGESAAARVPLTPVSASMKALVVEAGLTIEPAERLEFATRIAATALAALQFERMNYVIFGSQIQALQVLASMSSAAREELEPLYEASGLLNRSFEQWLAFLLNFGACRNIDGDRIEITDFGREFLKHLIDQGYTTKRPL